MKLIRRKLIWIALGIGLMALMGLFVWQFFLPPKDSSSKNAGPRLILYGAKLIGREKGRTAWEISAPRIELSDDQQMAFFKEGPSGVFWAKEGGGQFSWKALSATYNSYNKTFQLEVDVEGQSDNGDRFSAAGAIWTNGLLRLPGSLEIQSGAMKIQAAGMESDADLNQFTLKGPVQGYDSEEGVTLTSQQLVYQKKNRTARFLSAIQVRGKDYQIEGSSGNYQTGSKVFELIKPHLSQKEVAQDGQNTELSITAEELKGDHKTKEFNFTGSVKGERKGKNLTQLESSKLIYHQGSGDFELLEKVVIRQKEKQIKGEKAVFSHKDQSLTVTGSVLIQNEKGEWLKAERATLYTETHVLESSGRVKGKILIQEE